ncbi:MAG: dephospho-CoA kinase [Deltaproteobacteria bacterium GWA2_57_13]|nr:MAG: dephospho-CoA kinase [Deltaproteobacteria bacterium GWA2_57_13]
MKCVGLTGGIATGKSTVASMLRELGAKVIDADQLAREIVQPGQEAWKEIVEAFGKEILRQDQSINREKLRRIVFQDEKARKRLEAITHPRIRALAQQKMQKLAADGAAIVIYEAPLLFENRIHLWLHPVILVACDRITQEQRLQQRDGLNEDEIQQHLNAQMSLDQKRRLADIIIENSGSLEALKKRVREVWEQIVSSSQ